jgi:hypothetical protein
VIILLLVAHLKVLFGLAEGVLAAGAPSPLTTQRRASGGPGRTGVFGGTRLTEAHRGVKASSLVPADFPAAAADE